MYYYDREGNEISLESWLKLSVDDFYKFIAVTCVQQQAMVVTLWRGYDQSGPKPTVKLFQTTVFRLATVKDTGAIELDTAEGPRWVLDAAWQTLLYDSESAAHAGHQGICERVCKALADRDITLRESGIRH